MNILKEYHNYAETEELFNGISSSLFVLSLYGYQLWHASEDRVRQFERMTGLKGFKLYLSETDSKRRNGLTLELPDGRKICYTIEFFNQGTFVVTTHIENETQKEILTRSFLSREEVYRYAVIDGTLHIKALLSFTFSDIFKKLREKRPFKRGNTDPNVMSREDFHEVHPFLILFYTAKDYTTRKFYRSDFHEVTCLKANNPVRFFVDPFDRSYRKVILGYNKNNEPKSLTLMQGDRPVYSVTTDKFDLLRTLVSDIQNKFFNKSLMTDNKLVNEGFYRRIEVSMAA